MEEGRTSWHNMFTLTVLEGGEWSLPQGSGELRRAISGASPRMHPGDRLNDPERAGVPPRCDRKATGARRSKKDQDYMVVDRIWHALVLLTVVAATGYNGP